MDAVGLFRLEVVDTGVGLSVEDQKRIFGEFTQFNKNELQGGGECVCMFACRCASFLMAYS